jgi:hexosaminidase
VAGNPDTKIILDDLELPDEQPDDFYGAILSGYIEVPEDGIYTFYLHVKDGGLLYINYNLVVNNDGFKYGIEKSGKVALEAGKHQFIIKYFMGKGWNELSLKYQLDDEEILPVLPEQYFTTKESVVKNP